MIKKDWLIAALEKTLEVVMDWLLEEQKFYNQKAKNEGKVL